MPRWFRYISAVMPFHLALVALFSCDDAARFEPPPQSNLSTSAIAPPEQKTEAIANSPTLIAEIAADLGTVLTDEKPIEHRFQLININDEPISVLDVESSSPCCASVLSKPTQLPPHSAASLVVSLKAQGQSGEKHVSFFIHSDSKAEFTRRCTLVANFVPSWQATPMEGEAILTLPLNQSATRRFRLIARSKPDKNLGCSLPVRIRAREPLRIANRSEPRTESGGDGLVTATQEVSVAIPASQTLGKRAHEIICEWEDGISRSFLVSWVVEPQVRVRPAGVTVRQNPSPVFLSVTITGDDRPFRIMRVVGAKLQSGMVLSESPAVQHTVRLEMDAHELGPRDISFGLDHPDQSSVTFTCLIMKPTGKNEDAESP